MCVNGAFFHGTRVPVGAAVHSVKSGRIFFISCLEPPGVIGWLCFGAHPAG